jgi:hypothetical protein
MSSNPIRIERALPFDGKIAGDIAITAAEGGIGYWSVIDHYDWRGWSEPDDSLGNIDVPDCFVFYTITVLDGDDDGWTCFDITPDLIRRGIHLFLGGANNFEGRDFADMDELAAMDSDEADCVIQLGCFGELVYG